MIRLHVLGTPVPKGSMRGRAIPMKGQFDRLGRQKFRALVTHDNKKTKPWAQQISECAAVAMVGREAFRNKPLWVSLRFVFPRPTSHFGKKGVRPSAPAHPMTKPDGDKLLRAALDALEGIVFDNDSRIVSYHVSKRYPGCALELPGLYVVIREAGEDGE